MYWFKWCCDRFSIRGVNLFEEVDDDTDFEYIARSDGFSRVPKIKFRYETMARKVMVDCKFDALYI